MDILYSILVAMPFVLLGAAIVANFRGLRGFFSSGREEGARGRNQMILALGWFFIVMPVYPVMYEVVHALFY
ncbi:MULTISPECIES: hypothetical protein [unclassified Streptomyces]|uniref:hypothetical protein n=1 Tax=unclassified Streptomyces TaxID=2593676 RepID=UPI0033D4635A